VRPAVVGRRGPGVYVVPALLVRLPSTS
jgi:hypothetical protein